MLIPTVPPHAINWGALKIAGDLMLGASTFALGVAVYLRDKAAKQAEIRARDSDVRREEAERVRDAETARAAQIWDENTRLRDGLWKEVERLEAEVSACRQETAQWRQEALAAKDQVATLQHEVALLRTQLANSSATGKVNV
jgi:chromosome segregation ATPase